MDVRSKYGDVIADSFLRIQVADSFKQLGIECSDISKATNNIALSLRGFGERLMLAEWLVVFHKLNNSTEVRREYNQANFVACLKRTIQEVYKHSGDVRYRMCKEETERDLSLIRKKCFKLDLMSVNDFDDESEQIVRFFDNKYFNY